MLLQCLELRIKNSFNNNFIRMSAYSMGKANKEPSFIAKNQAPGVGAYETKTWNKVSRVKTSPSATMSRSKKFFDPHESGQVNVGPGSYNPQKPQTKLAASLKGRSKISYNTEAPSPANYNVEAKFSSKKYSFGRSNRKFKTQQGPGPANYTVKVLQEKTGTVFGKQQRNKLSNQKLPGPGAYNSKEIDNFKGFQQYSFPKQKKFVSQQAEIKQKSKVPGPGAYCISGFKQIYRGGKFTYGQRMNIANKSEAPGPGFYNPNYASEKKNPNPIIGQEKRQFYNSTATPGPGSYQMPKPQLFKKKDGVAVFTHDERQRKIRSQTPGPGSYNTKPLNQSRAHSIGSRHKMVQKEKAPGPQEYNPDFSTIQKKAGRTIFGSERKLNQAKQLNPGPGQYKIEVQDKGKTYYFNKAKSSQRLGSTVGPGQYKLKPYIGMYNGARKQDKEILYV